MCNYVVPGCKVLLTDKRPHGWNSEGLMDRYLGRVVEIAQIEPVFSDHLKMQFTFTIIQDKDDLYCVCISGKWLFDSSDIVSVIYSPIHLGDIITTKKSVIHNLSNSDLDKEQETFKYYLQKYDKNVGNVTGHGTIQRLDFIGEVIGEHSDYYIVKVIKSRCKPHGATIMIHCKDAFKLTFRETEDIEKMLKMTEVSFNIKNKEEGKEKMEQICNSYDTMLCCNTTSASSTPFVTAQQMLSCKKILVIPKIKDYKVYQNKTVVVDFADGTKYHVTCTEKDTFDLEVGIEKCILKKMCGENFKNQIQAIIRNHEKAEKLAKKQVAAQKAEREAREKRYLKNKERKLRRRVQKEAEFQVALQLKKEELIKKLAITDKQKKTLN